jgi:hypothetical protein
MSGDGAQSNGDRSVDDRDAAAGLADFLGAPTRYPNDERRLIYAKGENTRHIRHAEVLERWPVLAEDWARRVEQKRLSSVDRTPGAATFGR